MKCIICNKRIPELEHFSDDPAGNCWNGGLVEWVCAGYGSIHDCSRFLICICDSCLSKLRLPNET